MVDWRRMPDEGWTCIYDKFDAGAVKVFSGRMLSLPDALARKASIVVEEQQRLNELKQIIGNFIRKSDGSEQAKRDINGMTEAMQNAIRALDYARHLPVDGFFKQCPLNTCRI